MIEKCFCHLNGYKVKDADARRDIDMLKTHIDDAFGASSDNVIYSILEKTANSLETNQQKRLLISTKSVEDGKTSLPRGAWVADVTRHLGSAEVHAKMGNYNAVTKYTFPAFNNPSFEEVEIPGWTTNAEEYTFISRKYANSGGYSLHVNHSGVHIHSSYVKATPGEEYAVSASVTGTVVGDVAQVYLQFFDKRHKQIQSKHANLVVDNIGHAVVGEVSAVAPKGAEYCYILLASASTAKGSIYFDYGVLSHNGETLNQNSDFADVKIPGWTFMPDNNYMLSDEEVKDRNGNYSLKITDLSSSQNYIAKSEKIPVTPGNTYGVSCDVKGKGTTPQIYVQFYIAGASNPTGSAHSKTLTDDSWNRLYRVMEAPEGATHCEVWLVSSGGSIGTIYFDNVDFAENPSEGWHGIENSYDRFEEWTIINAKNLAEKCKKKSFRYYVKASGSDQNDGLSEATAFKTMDKFFSVLNEGASDIRCYIMEAGEYNVSANMFTFSAIHITGYVPGVVLNFVEDNWSDGIVFYNCHVNFERIKMKAEGEQIRFESGVASLEDVTLECEKVAFWDCQIECETTLNSPNISMFGCNGRIKNLTITSETGNAVSLDRGNNIRIYGTLALAPRTDINEDVAVNCMHSVLYLNASDVTAGGWHTGVRNTASMIFLPQTTYTKLYQKCAVAIEQSATAPGVFVNGGHQIGADYV